MNALVFFCEQPPTPSESSWLDMLETKELMWKASAEVGLLKDCTCSIDLQTHFHDFFLIDHLKYVAETVFQ